MANIAKIDNNKLKVSGVATDNLVTAWTLNDKGEAWKWFGSSSFKDGWWIFEKDVPNGVVVGTQILVQIKDAKIKLIVQPTEPPLNITVPYVDIQIKTKLLSNSPLTPKFIFDDLDRHGDTKEQSLIPYPGCIRVSGDGGGRFNKNGKDADVYVEDSFWIGGYWGIGGTPEKPADWDKRWVDFDPEKVKEYARQIKTTAHIIDVETWALDIRTAPTELVQNNINKFRLMFKLLKEGNPNVDYSLYGVPPIGDYWNALNYYTTLEVIETGIIPPNHPGIAWWKARLPEVTANFKSWQKANDRLTYDIDLFGKTKETGGLLGALDFLSPSLYLHYNRGFKDTITGEISDIAADKAVLKANLDETIRIGKGMPYMSYIMPWVAEYSVDEAAIKNNKGDIIGYDTEKLKISDKRWNAMLDVLKEKNSHSCMWWTGPRSPYIDNLYNLTLKKFGGYFGPELMSSGLGIGVSQVDGDITGDGKVNFDDLLKFAQNYGK